MFIDAGQVRAWLMDYQFWWLELLFILFAVCTARALPPLVRSLGVGVGWWLSVAGIAALGLVAAYGVPPTTSRIYYDEQIYQNVGQNMAALGRTQMCNHGLVQGGALECESGEYNKEPYGYPYLLSLWYRLLGTSDTIAHHVNRWAHAALALLLAVAAVRWFGRPRAGIAAALLISLVPEQLRWVATAAAEPSAALFGLVAVLAAVDFSRSRTNGSLAWLLAAGAWAIQFRPESVLVAPVAAGILLLEAPSVVKDPRRPQALAALIVPATLYLLHMIAVQHDSWGASGAAFSWSHVPGNLAVNGWYYLSDPRFPGWIALLALSGLVAGRTSMASRAGVALYFVLFWGIFLFFYAGSYNYGADVRYSLVSYAPLVLLAGLGVDALIARVVAWVPSRAGFATGIAMVALVAGASPYLPHARSIGEEAWAARADVAYAKSVATTLPEDALVLTQDPSMFHLWGVHAAQLSYMAQPGFVDRITARHGGRVFVHWGFWCNVNDEVQRQFCRDAIAGRRFEQVSAHTERDYRFAFYRLILPTPGPG